MTAQSVYYDCGGKMKICTNISWTLRQVTHAAILQRCLDVLICHVDHMIQIENLNTAMLLMRATHPVVFLFSLSFRRRCFVGRSVTGQSDIDESPSGMHAHLAQEGATRRRANERRRNHRGERGRER